MIKAAFLYLLFFTFTLFCTHKSIPLKNNGHLFYMPLYVAQSSETLLTKIKPLKYPQKIQQHYWDDAQQPWDISELGLSHEEIYYFITALNICVDCINAQQAIPYSEKNSSLFPSKSAFIKKEKLTKLLAVSRNFSLQSYLNIYTLCTYFITPLLQQHIEKKLFNSLIKNPECCQQWPFVFSSEKNIVHHILVLAQRYNIFFLLPYTTLKKIAELPLQKISGSYCSLTQTAKNTYTLCDSQGTRYELHSDLGKQTIIHTPPVTQDICYHEANNDTVATIDVHGLLKITHNMATMLDNVQVLSASIQKNGNYSYESADHDLIMCHNKRHHTYTLIPYHSLFFKGTSTHHKLSADGSTVCIIQKYFYLEPSFLHNTGEVLFQYNASQKKLKTLHIKKHHNPTQTALINDQGSVILMFKKELQGNEQYIHYLDITTEKEVCIPLPECTEPILAASYNPNTLQLVLLHQKSVSFWDTSCHNLTSKDLTFLLLSAQDPLLYQKYSHIPWINQSYNNLPDYIKEEISPVKHSRCSLL